MSKRKARERVQFTSGSRPRPVKLPLHSVHRFDLMGGPSSAFRGLDQRRLFYRVHVNGDPIPAGSRGAMFDVRDFSVPTIPQAEAIVTAIVEALVRGDSVYVACGYGQGRTGLALALVAKVFGASDPVEYVREHYNPLAVETPQQEAFVATFPVWGLRWRLARAALKRRLAG